MRERGVEGEGGEREGWVEEVWEVGRARDEGRMIEEGEGLR